MALRANFTRRYGLEMSKLQRQSEALLSRGFPGGPAQRRQPHAFGDRRWAYQTPCLSGGFPLPFIHFGYPGKTGSGPSAPTKRSGRSASRGARPD